MADVQQSLQRCAQARQYLKSAKAMKGSKALVLKAVALYKEALQEHGQELAEPYFGLAYIAYAGGRPDIAVSFLKAGLQLDAKHSRMRNLMPRALKGAEKRAAVLAQRKAQAEAQDEASAEAESGPPPNELSSDLGPANKPNTLSQGAEVLMLQRTLQKLGHSLMLSAEFDRPTYAAVRSVQSLHKLPVTGVVDAATREILNPVVRMVLAEQKGLEQLLAILEELNQALGIEANAFVRQMSAELCELILTLLQDFPEEEEAPSQEEDPPFPAREPLSSRLGNMGQMGIVSKGPEVERVQQVLVKLGYPVKVNGQFDLQTFSELSRFQLEENLGVNGIVEGATQTRFNQLLEPIFHEEAAQEAFLKVLRDFQAELELQRWPTLEQRRSLLTQVLFQLLQTGQMPEIPSEVLSYFQLQSELGPANRPGKVSQGREVRLLQQLLRSLGYNKVEINGSYDNSTYAAVRSFQISKKLPMNGMVDVKTREELNSLLLHVLGRQREDET